MDIDRFKHFEVVARTLHFGRAADILGIDQSILSRSIKRLEEETGAQLLDRSRRHVVLTPAGQIFLEEARKAIEAVERATRAARLAGTGQVSDLNLAVSETAVFSFVPRAIRQFRDVHPETQLCMVDFPSPSHLQHLRDGDVDICLLMRIKNNRQNLDPFSVKMLRRYSMKAVVPKNWPIAKRDNIKLIELAEYPFIGLHNSRVMAEIVNGLMTACRNAGFTPKVVQDSWQVPITMGLIAEGVGVGLHFELGQMTAPNVKFLDVVDLPNSLQLEALAVWDPHRQLEPVANFIESMVSAAESEQKGEKLSPAKFVPAE